MTFRRPRTRAIRALNNIYVVNSIARKALVAAKSELKAQPTKKLNYAVPTTSGDRITVERRRSKILSLLEETIDRDLFTQSIIAAVAIVEAYLVTTLTRILAWYPGKLSNGEKKVDLSLILESDDLDELLGEIIERRVNTAFYASPAEYFQFLERTLTITIPSTLKVTYAEIKATRDILVHNGGVVNSTYLKKAGRKARAEDGEDIPINKQYFDKSLPCMKRLVGTVYSAVLKKYGDV